MADVEEYVRAVTGSLPPQSCKDVASLLYRFSYDLSVLLISLQHPENNYQYKIAVDKVATISKALLIQAKHCEDIHLTLF